MKFTIGRTEFGLSVPASYAVRHEVSLAAGSNYVRAAFAALGLCWVGAGRPKARYAYNVQKYGGEVIDELVARGVSVELAIGPASAAWQLMADGIISGVEVKEARDFSSAGQDGNPAEEA